VFALPLLRRRLLERSRRAGRWHGAQEGLRVARPALHVEFDVRQFENLIGAFHACELVMRLVLELVGDGRARLPFAVRKPPGHQHAVGAQLHVDRRVGIDEPFAQDRLGGGVHDGVHRACGLLGFVGGRLGLLAL